MNKLLFFLSILLLSSELHGQHSNLLQNEKSASNSSGGYNNASNITPQNLGDVDLFTGHASINVPIVQKKFGSVGVDVSLGYSSSGMPNAMASNIGLGWELNNGYKLTRIVKGNADDELDGGNLYFMDYAGQTGPAEYRSRMKGYLRNSASVPLDETSSGNTIANYYVANEDPEQDVFSLTLSNQTVKFVIGKNGQVFTFAPCDWKIEFSYNTQPFPGSFTTNNPANTLIDKFNITDENGNKYFFNALVYNPGTGSKVLLPTNPPSNDYEPSGGRSPIQEWFITKIENYFGQVINFNYINTDADPNAFWEIEYLNTPNITCHNVTNTGSTCYTNQVRVQPGGMAQVHMFSISRKPYLESISFPDQTSVSFIYGAQPRRDAHNLGGTRKSLPLKEIWLKKNGGTFSGFTLYQSYFDPSQPGGTLPLNSTIYNNSAYHATASGWPWYSQTLGLRLKLDSIVVFPYYTVKYLFQYDMQNNFGNRLGSIDSRLLGVNMLKRITLGDDATIDYEYESNSGRAFNFSNNALDANYVSDGSVRIKKTTMFDGVNHSNDIIKKYEYLNADNSGSGMFFSKAVNDKPFYCFIEGNTTISNSNSLFHGFGFTKNGSAIGYSRVSVIYGANGEGGKEIFNFSNVVNGSEINILSGTSNLPPFVNGQSIKEWNIGLLKKKETYSSSNVLKKDETYEYINNQIAVAASMMPYFKNLKYDSKNGDPGGFNSSNYTQSYWDFYKKLYYPVQGYSLLKKKTVNEYTANGTATGIEELTYDAKLKLKILLSKASNGKYYETRNYRVYDYSVGAGPFQNMIYGNRQNEIIRTDQWVKETLTSPYSCTSSSIKVFGNILIDAANKIYRVEPTSTYELNKYSPVPESAGFLTFDPTMVIASGAIFNILYRNSFVLGYNSLGLNTTVKKNESLNALLYDNGSTSNVIAKVQNAREEDIAYTSFENGQTVQGGWFLETQFINSGSGLTGASSAVSSRNAVVLQKTLTPAKTYRISVWALSGIPTLSFNTGASISLTYTGKTTQLGWKLYEGVFTGKTSCSILSGSQIDEVRLCPLESSMTTFTYDPFLGLLSECNQQCSPVNYVYDFLGRLIEKKDEDGKILNEYMYGQGN